jgi:hypothetical protein
VKERSIAHLMACAVCRLVGGAIFHDFLNKYVSVYTPYGAIVVNGLNIEKVAESTVHNTK